MKIAKSLKYGGELISAEECNYESFKSLMPVCPNCSEPLFLRMGGQRTSKLGKEYSVHSHWCHFKGVSEEQVAGCELRVSGFTDEDRKKIANKARGQRLKVIQRRIWRILCEGFRELYGIHTALSESIDSEECEQWKENHFDDIPSSQYRVFKDHILQVKYILEVLKRDGIPEPDQGVKSLDEIDSGLIQYDLSLIQDALRNFVQIEENKRRALEFIHLTMEKIRGGDYFMVSHPWIRLSADDSQVPISTSPIIATTIHRLGSLCDLNMQEKIACEVFSFLSSPKGNPIFVDLLVPNFEWVIKGYNDGIFYFADKGKYIEISEDISEFFQLVLIMAMPRCLFWLCCIPWAEAIEKYRQ